VHFLLFVYKFEHISKLIHEVTIILARITFQLK